MKYFIENKEGEWLMDPDEVMRPGIPNCWTRDPLKAWGLNKEDLPPGISSSETIKIYNETGMILYTVGIDPYPVEPWILSWLKEEGVLAPDTKLTEHEFTEVFNMDYTDLTDDIWLKGFDGRMWKIRSTISKSGV